MPRRATMAPAFSTSPPTSAASPASPTVMRPSFTTRAPRAFAAAERQPAVALEAGGVDALAGGDQAADVDAGAAGEEHAGAVLDDDRAGGADRALDHARPRRLHAVERGGAPARLGEDDRVVAADVEARQSITARWVVCRIVVRPARLRRCAPAAARRRRLAGRRPARFRRAARARASEAPRSAQERAPAAALTRGAEDIATRELHVQEMQSGVVSRRNREKSTELFREPEPVHAARDGL